MEDLMGPDFSFFKLPISDEDVQSDNITTNKTNVQTEEDTEKEEEDGDKIIASTEESSFRRDFDDTRQWIRETMNLNGYQLTVVILVILDMVLVIGQLMLDLQGAHHLASLSLHYMSLALLSIFFLEILIKLVAFQWEFFSHKLEVLDAIVVIVAFALDIVYLDSNDAHSGLGLIIVLRLWRLVRIQNAMMLQVRRVEEKKVHREQQLRLSVEEQLQRYRAYVATLQEILTAHNISFERELI